MWLRLHGRSETPFTEVDTKNRVGRQDVINGIVPHPGLLNGIHMSYLFVIICTSQYRRILS